MDFTLTEEQNELRQLAATIVERITPTRLDDVEGAAESFDRALWADLAKAGLLSSMPSLGMVATLIAWGYIVDRVGERIVLALGSVLTAAAAFAGASVHSLVAVGAFLLLGGMAAASSN